MGARNVRAALLADKVSDRAVRVLVAMSLVAFDRTTGDREARVCWLTREQIATVAGRLPDDAGVRYVGRALVELVAGGYVERTVVGVGPGRSQVYRLHLPSVENPAESVNPPVDRPP